MRNALAVFFLLAGLAWAQPIPSGGGGGGLTNVTTLPATCTPSGSPNSVFLTAGYSSYSAGPYFCSATNTWSYGIGSGTFTALSGDATSTATGGATSVVKVNGGAIPASKTVVGTNSSNQFIDATSSLPTASSLGLVIGTVGGLAFGSLVTYLLLRKR